MKRLDDVAVAYPSSVGLKIDTEGFELPILKGGPETLKRCEFVIAEVSVTKRFDGIEPPSTLITYLASHGLELREMIGSSSFSIKKDDLVFSICCSQDGSRCINHTVFV